MAINHPHARTRSSSEREDFVFERSHHTRIHPLTGEASSSSSNTVSYFSETRSMNDVSLPNYRSLRKMGSIVMNPVESKYTKTYPLAPNFRSQYRVEQPIRYRDENYVRRNGILTNIYREQQVVLPSTTTASPPYQKVEALAEQSLLGAHAKAAASISQLLVTAGEFRKTLDLLIGVKKRFAERLVHLLRSPSKKEGFKRALNVTGDSWLEARYGWRPLIHDVDNIWEAFTSHFAFNKVYRDQYIVSSTDIYESPQAFAQIGAHDFQYHTEQRSTTRAKTVILYRINPSFLNEIDHRFGLTSVLSTAWELVPFSFVVDWFLTIGDWLTHLENSDMITVVDACTSTRIHRSSAQVLDDISQRNMGTYAKGYSASFRSNYAEETEYDRRVDVSLPPFPGLNFKPLQTSHKIDAFFLVRQLL